MHEIHAHLAHHEERVRAALACRRADHLARLHRLDRRAAQAAARARLARLLLS